MAQDGIIWGLRFPCGGCAHYVTPKAFLGPVLSSLVSSLKPSEVPGFSPIYFQNWTLPKILAEPDPVLRLLYSFAGN